ncbi:MAG TPA: hypothetical protein VMZ28_03990, partial [Kofleriaceae bacterium]|nr:hypothetical protein [Kofleriaceae bacterium]
EVRAGMSVIDDVVCLQCNVEVSPSETGSYPGEVQDLTGWFDQMAPDEFGTAFQILVGSKDNPEPYADAIVDVSLSCQGHGYSGVVARQDIKLTLPPDAE